jgi:glycine betaine/proline transport system substrate-binding protein
MKSLFHRTMVCAAVLSAWLLALPASQCPAYQEKPGQGVTVQQGRCTWDTGYFHETLVRKALTELGYDCKEPKMLQNSLFYASVVQGSIDYWANSWFPNQYSQLPKNFYEKADAYGYVLKAGGLQGYTVDKKHQEKFNITSLADFKRPEVKNAFDRNGDGKADLYGGPQGWKVAEVMAHHIEVYGLADHVNLVQAAYNAIFADVLGNFKSGNGVLYYTWAPNWSVYELRPGKEVMWINVPKIEPLPEFEDNAKQMVASDVEGAVSDPIKLGFVINDIRIVANNEFVNNNPAAKKFFEVFRMSVEDISSQNAKMKNGENKMEDIERHADEWIAANPDKWQNWLEQARKAAP